MLARLQVWAWQFLFSGLGSSCSSAKRERNPQQQRQQRGQRVAVIDKIHDPPCITSRATTSFNVSSTSRTPDAKVVKIRDEPFSELLKAYGSRPHRQQHLLLSSLPGTLIGVTRPSPKQMVHTPEQGETKKQSSIGHSTL